MSRLLWIAWRDVRAVLSRRSFYVSQAIIVALLFAMTLLARKTETAVVNSDAEHPIVLIDDGSGFAERIAAFVDPQAMVHPVQVLEAMDPLAAKDALNDRVRSRELEAWVEIPSLYEMPNDRVVWHSRSAARNMDYEGISNAVIYAAAERSWGADRVAALRDGSLFQFRRVNPPGRSSGGADDVKALASSLPVLVAILVLFLPGVVASSVDSSASPGLLDRLDSVASDLEILAGKALAGIAVAVASFLLWSVLLAIAAWLFSGATGGALSEPPHAVGNTPDIPDGALGAFPLAFLLALAVGWAHGIGVTSLLVAINLLRTRIPSSGMFFKLPMYAAIPTVMALLMAALPYGDSPRVWAMSWVPGFGAGFALMSHLHGMAAVWALGSAAWRGVVLVLGSAALIRMGRAFQAIGGWPRSRAEWRAGWGS